MCLSYRENQDILEKVYVLELSPFRAPRGFRTEVDVTCAGHCPLAVVGVSLSGKISVSTPLSHARALVTIGNHYRFRRGNEGVHQRCVSPTPHDALALLVAHLQEHQEEVSIDIEIGKMRGLAQAVDEGIVGDIS